MPEEESFKEIKLKGEAVPKIDYALIVDPMTHIRKDLYQLHRPEVKIRFGYPHQEAGFFSIEDIDNLITGLQEAKKELEKVV